MYVTDDILHTSLLCHDFDMCKIVLSVMQNL